MWKNLWIMLIVLSGLMLWVSAPLASDSTCFGSTQIDDIIVRLEKGQICEEQIPLYDQALAEKDVKITEAQKQYGECERKIEVDRKISGEKDLARVQEIKKAGKTQWGLFFGGAGVGAVFLGLLVILL